MKQLFRSIARSDLDLSYITSRLLVMPYPAEGLETAYRTNNAEDIRALLEARHMGRYCIYNVSGRSYPPGRLGSGRVSFPYAKLCLLSYLWSHNTTVFVL